MPRIKFLLANFSQSFVTYQVCGFECIFAYNINPAPFLPLDLIFGLKFIGIGWKNLPLAAVDWVHYQATTLLKIKFSYSKQSYVTGVRKHARVGISLRKIFH